MEQRHDRIRPVRGAVVRQAAAHDVVSPAYDSLTTAQRKQFRQDHPDSYLHVTRSAADEPDWDTVDNATLVARGREALEALLKKQLFHDVDGEPAFFVYRLVLGGHAQLGLVCEIDSDYFGAIAKPHEATQPSRAALLAEHFLTVKAASSPIACAARDDGSLEQLLVQAATGDPMLDVSGDDGLQQTVWRIDDPATADQIQDRLRDESLYIIDGHHRAAAHQQLRAAGTPLPVLTTIFPEQSLHLVGFHRMVQLPPALAPAEFLRRVARRFRVETVSDVATVEPGHVAMVIEEEWHVVYLDERPIAGGAQIRLGSLDPVVLERELLESIVGSVGDYEVSFTPDTEPFPVLVEQATATGRVPIFVPPVAIGDMMAVAEGGVIMPAKSTYFTPKVRSGLFLRLFDELD